MKQPNGMSLIELVVVVAIIGILSAIAHTSYRSIFIRVRLAEAKSVLSDIYTKELVYNSEWDTYTTRLDAMGFSFDGTIWSTVGFAVDVAPPATAPQGTSTCTHTCGIGTGSGPPVCRSPNTWTCAASALCGMDGTIRNATTATALTFLAHSHAHFNGCPSPIDAYTLTIDQTKRIREDIVAD